jgi:phosphoribosylformylglycinamidine (FGAM) synthase-like enzyme
MIGKEYGHNITTSQQLLKLNQYLRASFETIQSVGKILNIQVDLENLEVQKGEILQELNKRGTTTVYSHEPDPKTTMTQRNLEFVAKTLRMKEPLDSSVFSEKFFDIINNMKNRGSLDVTISKSWCGLYLALIEKAKEEGDQMEIKHILVTSDLMDEAFFTSEIKRSLLELHEIWKQRLYDTSSNDSKEKKETDIEKQTVENESIESKHHHCKYEKELKTALTVININKRVMENIVEENAMNAKYARLLESKIKTLQI